MHRAKINHGNSSRIGTCSIGGEKWHREVVACFDVHLKVLGGDGSIASSHPGLILDGSPGTVGSTTAYEPTRIPRFAWSRW
ncbi:MAG: hypothetical protein QXE99_00860 [Acidilobaceae archaeon]